MDILSLSLLFGNTKRSRYDGNNMICPSTGVKYSLSPSSLNNLYGAEFAPGRGSRKTISPQSLETLK
jgi:hypothetical protein